MSSATATLCWVPWKLVTCSFLSLFLIDSVATTQSGVSCHEADTLRCQRHGLNVQCPPGQYRQTASTPNTTGQCMPCVDGKNFTEYPNGLPACIACRVCRPDQEEAMRCNTTRNTQCHCKSGTFCPKDHPCEICRKCKSKCPEGKVEVSPCSPWSDLKCDNPQPSDTRNPRIRAPLLAVVFIVVVVLGSFFWCICCAVSKADNLSPRHPLDFKEYLLTFLGSSYHARHPEAQDNEHVETPDDLQGKADSPENQGDKHLGQLMAVITIPNTSAQNGYHLEQAKVTAPQVNPKSLFPADGDHIKTLEKSFFIFEQEVPWEAWNQFMRQLGLTHNEIQQARASERNVMDHPHILLMTWLNKTGKAATVDFLLETLDKIHQKAAREIILDKLISSRLYDYQKREDEKPN